MCYDYGQGLDAQYAVANEGLNDISMYDKRTHNHLGVR